MARMEPTLTIQQVSRRSGVAASALRYYEELSLIRSERAPSGHRRYARPTLRRIAFIVFAQRVGLSLREVGEELARLPTDRVPTGEDWSRLSGRWSARIDQRMDELARLKEGLTDCIGCGCLSLASCKLVNADDAARRLGPGPRAWMSDALD